MELSRMEMENEIDNVVKILQIVEKRKEKFVPAEGSTAEGETVAEEYEEEKEVMVEYVTGKLFEKLDIPQEIASLISFKNADSYKQKILNLQAILEKMKKTAFIDGVDESNKIDAAMNGMQGTPTPAKKIADAMGVKTPSIFRRR